jgi:enoyl-[acyl-carrier protein] reductase I
VRYLAYELGPASIRVNAISAGPVRTLASAGIAGFKDMEAVIEERSPMRRNIDAADVGQAALYLCSPMSRMVTGTTVYVDSGYHAMGI